MRTCVYVCVWSSNEAIACSQWDSKTHGWWNCCGILNGLTKKDSMSDACVAYSVLEINIFITAY